VLPSQGKEHDRIKPTSDWLEQCRKRRESGETGDIAGCPPA
jgi:hypothetical protein